MEVWTAEVLGSPCPVRSAGASTVLTANVRSARTMPRAPTHHASAPLPTYAPAGASNVLAANGARDVAWRLMLIGDSPIHSKEFLPCFLMSPMVTRAFATS